MLGWLAQIISPIAGIGEKYVEGKNKVAAAKIDYEVAKLEAKKDLASREIDTELAHLAQTATLDQMAMRQQQKSRFDECLAIFFLSPIGFLVYGVVVDTPPKEWGTAIFHALDQTPDWYKLVVAGIFINYFAFRSLLRYFIKIWGQRKGLKMLGGADEDKQERL